MADRTTDTQQQSRAWWQGNPMAYDWRQPLTAPEGTPEYFAEIDRRFFASSPFYEGTPPFRSLIPFARLVGKRVLGIGCGLSSHAHPLAESGCQLASGDLTPRSVELRRRRLEQRGLQADVREMDAETLQFDDDEFDFGWSWGVIHHSAN